MAVLRWPSSAEWSLRHRPALFTPAALPFNYLYVDFKARSGSIWLGLNGTRTFINNIRLWQSDGGGKFSFDYTFGGSHGKFEAALADKYWLDIELTGTPAVKCRAEPENIVGGEGRIVAMSPEERMNEAAHWALGYMPSDVAQQISGMLSVQAFAIMTATFGVAIAAQVYGGPVAVAADVVLLAVGALLLGPQAYEVGQDLIDFYATSRNAQTDEEIDTAAKAFARAVATIGVNVIAAILFAKGSKAFKDAFVKPGTAPARTGAPRPKTPGRLFWDPDTVRVDFKADLGGPDGTTFESGKIGVDASLQGHPLAQLRVLRHERVHQLITRLASITQITFEMRVWAYERVYLFRYLEEALAEFYAGRIYGEPPLESFQFAIRNGYIEAKNWQAGMKALDYAEAMRGKRARAQVDAQIHARETSFRTPERPTDPAKIPQWQEAVRRSVRSQREATSGRLEQLYQDKAALEAARNPLEEVLNHYIRLPGGERGLVQFRMRGYVDVSPFLTEGAFFLGTLMAGGSVYNLSFKTKSNDGAAQGGGAFRAGVPASLR